MGLCLVCVITINVLVYSRYRHRNGLLGMHVVHLSSLLSRTLYRTQFVAMWAGAH